MDFVIEAAFIGLYCNALYFILSQFVTQYSILLFCVGILKHLTLRTLYCKFGSACVHQIKKKVSVETSEELTLLLEFLVEGFVFLLGGYGLSQFFSQFTNRYLKTKMFVVFLTGFLLHLLGEVFEIHRRFCEERCSS